MRIFKNKFFLTKKDKQEISTFLDKMVRDGKFINGPTVKKFEKFFSIKNKSKYCIGFSSSSTAISSIMNILYKEGKEILIPVFSPIPVAASIKNYNFKIRYVDVDIETFLMRSDLQNVINTKTSIIMPVHIFGNVFDVNNLKKKINKKIKIIEDSSQAHFSKINGEYVGSNSYASIYSFYPTKNLNAFGDAGCILTNNLNLSKKLKSYRNYGLHPKFDKLVNFGNNFRIDELQAMIILMNLKKVKRFNNLRSNISKFYKYNLNNLPLKFQKIYKNVETNNHVFSIIVDAKYRDKLNNFLVSSGINTSIYYKKLLPAFTDQMTEKTLRMNFPNGYALSKSILNLPIHPFLSMKEIEYICKKIILFFKK